MTRENKINTLYLSYDGLTDPLGQSQILPYLAGLSADYAITIVSFEKPERLKSEGDTIQKFCDTHGLKWVPLTYHKSPPVLSTLYDVWTLRRTVGLLHRERAFRLVHCRSYITALVGLRMKRTQRVKFIFDMRGFWADERVDGGLWNLRNPLYERIYTFFKNRERAFMQEADAVISLTQNAKDEILQWKLTTAIDVIPCCVDLTHFDPAKVEANKLSALREQLSIGKEQFVLLYLGSLGTWYLVDEMLQFFAVLKTKIPDAKFLVVTPDTLDLDGYAHRDDVIVRRSSRQDVPRYIRLASASLIFIKPAFSKKASSATKMAEVLAMGVPVIANAGWGDVEWIMETLHGGVLLNGFTPQEYERAAEAILVFIRGNNGGFRDAVKGPFSLATGVDRYRAVYQRLVGES